MTIEGKKIGFAVCGSFCTFSRVMPQVARLCELGAEVSQDGTTLTIKGIAASLGSLEHLLDSEGHSAEDAAADLQIRRWQYRRCR